jgi:putative transposase
MDHIPAYHSRRSIRLPNYDYSKEGMYFITLCCWEKAHRFGKIVDGAMILNELGKIANDEWLDLKTRFPHIELGAHQIMPNHMHGIIIIVGAGLAPAHIPSKSPTHIPSKSPVYTPAQSEKVTSDQISPQKGTLTAANIPRQSETFEPALIRGQSKIFSNNDNPAPPDSKKHTEQNHITIGNIIGAYKSLVFNKCLKIFKTKNKRMGKLWHRNYFENVILNENAFHNISEYIINNPETWEKDRFHSL